MGKKGFLFGVGLTVFCFKAGAQLHARPDSAAFPVVGKLLPLPQNFYTQHLSFFCKKEDQLQRRTGLNLYLRLGSKQYVDWMERKPNAQPPRP